MSQLHDAQEELCKALGLDLHKLHITGVTLRVRANKWPQIAVSLEATPDDLDAVARVVRKYRLVPEAEV